MKKIFTVLLASLMLLVFGGCGGDSAAATSSSKAAPAAGSSSASSSGAAAAKDAAGTKTLVVYFSATGNTKALAGTCAKVLGADEFEIVPVCTSISSDIGSSGDYLHKFAPKANWKDGKRFDKGASEAEVKSFFDGLGLKK